MAGGVLAAWAVLVALMGITHAEFPGSQGRARLVMLTSFVLVAATMAAAVLTGGEAGHEAEAGVAPSPKATGRTLALAADPSGALRFDKKSAAVLAGKVTVTLTNDSPVGHNVTIAKGHDNLGATKTITKGKDTLSVQLAPGQYVFFCSVAGHREGGMVGPLTVEP